MSMNGWVSSECGNLAPNTASTLAANQTSMKKIITLGYFRAYTPAVTLL